MTKQITKSAPAAVAKGKTALPVQTVVIQRALASALDKWTRATVSALAAQNTASHNLCAAIQQVAKTSGVIDDKTFDKYYKPTVTEALEKAVKAGAISDTAKPVYATRLKVYLIGHSRGMTAGIKEAVPGLRNYYDAARPLLTDANATKAGGSKGAGRKASPKAPTPTGTPAQSIAPVVKPDALKGVVLPPVSGLTPDEGKARYLGAATALVGEKYAEPLCMLIAEDKTRLTKILDAFMAERVAGLKPAPQPEKVEA